MAEIKLSTDLDANGLKTVNFFRSRYSELMRNWDELNEQQINLSGWIGKDEENLLNASPLNISIHRIKGLYIDFRFFWGEKEVSNFYNIQKLIGKLCCESDPVRRALKFNKNQWKKAGAGKKFHNINTEEMFHAIFYGAIIHELDEKQELLNKVNEVFNAATAHKILVSTISERIYPLKSIFWMLEPLSLDHQYIQIPDAFA